MPVLTRVLEVPLPEGVEPEPQEVELLQAALAAIVALRFEHGRSWEAARARLTAAGWQVSASLAWCAEARRGHDHERALGATRDEAFAELESLTRFDDLLGGVP
jgi:hypothetical protein